MATSEEKPRGFVVNDRRLFTGEGETPATPEPPPAPASEPSPKPSAAPPRAMPPVDFQTFVISLGSSALLHLGEVEDPDSGQRHKDLVMAKHTIDVLSMLQQKTRGNLTGHEDGLLESLLYDLRLRFVEASKA